MTTWEFIKIGALSLLLGMILGVIFMSYTMFGEEDNIILVGLCVGLITILNTLQRKFVQHEENRELIEDLKDTLLYTGILVYTINRFNLNESWNWWCNLLLYTLIYTLLFFVLTNLKNK